MSMDSTWSTPPIPAEPTPPTVGVPVLPQVSEGPALIGGGDFLGSGLTRPFRRDRKLDFASANGVRLVASCAGQVLGTRSAAGRFQGELPWRDEFGSSLYMVRHRANDDTTRELARIGVVEALTRWEPRVQVTNVEIIAEDVEGLGEVAIGVRAQFDIISRNSASNAVLMPGIEATIPLG